MSDMIQARYPIMDGDDPRVRHLAQMMADTLEAMVRLDRDSVVATDVLFMMMRDALWCRDNYTGANNPNISEDQREALITLAKTHVLDVGRFIAFSKRYIAAILNK